MNLNKRIFIVDDDAFWATMLHQQLTNLGYLNIFTFENGEDCLDHLHLNPQMVFLDYQMEEANGLDILPKIKAYYPGISVVLCTAYEDLSVAVEALENGCLDYLLKGKCTPKEIAQLMEVKASRPSLSLNI